MPDHGGDRNVIHVRGRGVALSTVVAVAFLCALTVGLLVVVPGSAFADFFSYEAIVEELRIGRLSDILTFEPFSRLILYVCGALNNNPSNAAAIDYYINGFIFLCTFVPLTLRYARTWRNVLLLGAVYSPLLAFVAYRATPAYLLAALAYFIRKTHPGRSLGICLLAVGFHVSAALALLPLLLTTGSGLSKVFSGSRSRWMDAWIVFTGVVLYLVLGGMVDVLPQVSGFLLGNSELAKFATYAVGAGEVQSIMHRVYFVMVLCTVIFLLATRRDTDTADVRYVTFSFAIYCVMSISPVVAFRQSLFWMIPLALILPLERYVNTTVLSFAYGVLCCVMYAGDFYGVLA